MVDRVLNELNTLTPQLTDLMPIARSNGPLSKITLSALQAILSTATFGTRSIREWLSDTTGVSDQRSQVVTAFEAAKNNAFKLIIDCPIYINVGSDHTRPIFLPENLYLDFTSNGKFIVNNKGVPTFAIVHNNNITFNNARFSWLNTIDTPFVTASGSFASNFNDITLRNWLIANKSVNFVNANPSWTGFSDYCATINIKGNCTNINFLGETLFTSENPRNAQNCMISGISLNAEVKANTTINSSTISNLTHDIPTDIYIEKLKLDGISMGIVGTMSGLVIETLISDRYTDVQDSAGRVAQWFSPPHAIYESTPITANFTIKDNFINEFIDHGVYVGNARRRGSGGYAHAFKLATFKIGRLISLRPDGIGDILAYSRSMSIDDLYGEYDSSLFSAEFTASTSGNIMTVTSVARGFIEADAVIYDNLDRSQYSNGQCRIAAYGTNGTTGTGGVGTYALTTTPTNTPSSLFYSVLQFSGLRFPGGSGSYNEVVIKKGVLKDKAPYSFYLPITSSSILANKNCFFDLKLFLNDFKGYAFPSFYMSGEGHQINFDLLLQAHTQTQKYVGIAVGAGTAPTGLKDVMYNCSVSGWRNILPDVEGLRNRVIFNGNDIDSYGNILKVTDVTNKHIITSYDGLLEELITITGVITPTAGGAFTSTLVLPPSIAGVNWIPVKSGAKILTSFNGPTSIQVGIAGTPTFLGTLTDVTNAGKFTTDGNLASASGSRPIVLTPVGGNFSGTGTVRISVTLKRTDMPV